MDQDQIEILIEDELPGISHIRVGEYATYGLGGKVSKLVPKTVTRQIVLEIAQHLIHGNFENPLFFTNHRSPPLLGGYDNRSYKLIIKKLDSCPFHAPVHDQATQICALFTDTGIPYVLPQHQQVRDQVSELVRECFYNTSTKIEEDLPNTLFLIWVWEIPSQY